MAQYSYCRVSGESQHLDRQEYIMNTHGISAENLYTEKLSGKDMRRPQLLALIQKLEVGDSLIVESVSRIARNTRDLLEIVDELTAKGVEFISLKEKIDTTLPTGKFMLTVFAGLYELERSTLLDRQREGIAAAKRRGVVFGRPAKEQPTNFAGLVKSWENKELPLQKMLYECGEICPATFYKWLAKHRGAEKNGLYKGLP